jgi:hypothetical protein
MYVWAHTELLAILQLLMTVPSSLSTKTSTTLPQVGDTN